MAEMNINKLRRTIYVNQLMLSKHLQYFHDVLLRFFQHDVEIFQLL